MQILRISKVKIVQTLFSLLIFLIPSNLFKILDDNRGYVNGLQIDYLISKLHASDVMLVALAVFLFFSNKKTRFYSGLNLKIVALAGMLVALQFFSPFPEVGLLFLARIVVTSYVALNLVQQHQKSILKSQLTKFTLVGTMVFQSVVSLLQFIKQSSVASYWFLGETNLLAFAGIAKGEWGNYEYILPYGTTAHPNVLAGILAVFFLIYLHKFLDLKKQIDIISGLALGTLCLGVIVITQSYSAGLTLAIGIILYFKPINYVHQKALPLIALFTIGTGMLFTQIDFNSLSFSRRGYLNSAAIAAFENNLVWGVGLHQFSGIVEKYSPVAEVVRFTQPAHNVPLLALAELGIVGIFIVWLLYQEMLGKMSKFELQPTLFICLIPILALDHYLYTIQSGILLFWLVCLFSLERRRI